MSNPTSVEPDCIITAMTSLKIHEAGHIATTDNLHTILTATDLYQSAQDNSHTVANTEATGTDPTYVDGDAAKP